MTAAGPLGPVLENPGMALAAAAVGVVLALAYLAAEYLVLPARRFRAARRRGPGSVVALIGRERLRLRRLDDRAALLEEHGHPDAGALRQEAEIGRLTVSVMQQVLKREDAGSP